LWLLFQHQVNITFSFLIYCKKNYSSNLNRTWEWQFFQNLDLKQQKKVLETSSLVKHMVTKIQDQLRGIAQVFKVQTNFAWQTNLWQHEMKVDLMMLFDKLLVSGRNGSLCYGPTHMGLVKFAGNMPFWPLLSLTPISQPSSLKEKKKWYFHLDLILNIVPVPQGHRTQQLV